MTPQQARLKRFFDFIISMTGLLMLWPVILVTWILARLDTQASGFFLQTRIGQGGQPFRVIKIRTMRNISGISVTTANDARITPLGRQFRKWKLDEIPQLWNVLKGEMSLVGPRPDVPGYMDKLTDGERRILFLRPGITGPATLKYRDEEEVLARVNDPQRYNDEVIFPDKVRINLDYFDNWSFSRDLIYIMRTIVK